MLLMGGYLLKMVVNIVNLILLHIQVVLGIADNHS